MKYVYFLVLLSFLLMIQNTDLFAQWQSKLEKKNVNQQQPFTLHELRNAFNEYWAPYNVQNGYYFENGIKVKASGWKQFRRAEWFWEQRVNPSTGEFPTTSTAIEFAKSQFRLNKSSGRTSTANWTNIGTNSSAGGYSGVGRVNCVTFHPSDANTYWIGSPAGGIWKTTNNGSNWSALNYNMSTLGVSDIAIPSDYVTSNTIYIATGDRNGGSLHSLGSGKSADNTSIGVYKSID
ncbi:MAG: hypothetical protein Q8L04_13950, partial [Ignavibacteria bacterium]|nr:hypothetical protein [Ignavibacteria bacterium]